MKYFYLNFTPADFTKNGYTWTTDTIDLYDNDQYRNYSVQKSKYGLNLLGDNTWTGLNDYGEVNGKRVTSSGFVENGRYIDTSANVDITRHHMEIVAPLTPPVRFHVNLYSNEDGTETFPDLWNSKQGIVKGRNIYRMGSERYVRFEIVWDNVEDTDLLDFTYKVQVEIDEPVMAPLFNETKSILDVFPEWMALREDSYEPEIPELATPKTVGGALINAVAGADLDDLRVSLSYLRSQLFLADADPNQKAWIYIAEDMPDEIHSVTGDGVELARAVNSREFYDSDVDDDVCFYVDFARLVWVNKKYDEFKVDGVDRTLNPIHVWNWFDEHGLLHNITRHHLESNESLRLRILDVYRNLPGVSIERIKLSLRRELNLWITDPIAATPATPDSFALGSTPTILEIDDILKMEEYFTPDGIPTDRMKELVNWMARAYPTTWGYFRWGNALWDPGGENNTGYSLLPHMFDTQADIGATPAPLQSGVGDMDDLYLYRPDEIDLVTDLDYKLRIKGLEQITGTEYREAYMQVVVNAFSEVDYYIDRAQAKITVWVVVDGIRYWSKIELDSGEVSSFEPLEGPRSRISLDLVDDSGNLNTNLEWGIDGDPDIVYSKNLSEGPLRANIDSTFYMDEPRGTVDSIQVQWGWDHDYDSTTPTNVAANGYGILQFTSDYEYGSMLPEVLPFRLTEDFTQSTIATLAPNAIGTKLTALDADAQLELVATWNNASPVRRDWRTPQQVVEITMNGFPPDNQKKSFVYTPIKNFIFPGGTVPGTEIWEVEIISLDGDQDPAATSSNYLDEPITIPASSIELNGSSAWVNGKMEFDYDPDLLMEFTTEDIPGVYPSVFYRWIPFTRLSADTYEGIVDANGAWFNGNPPNEQSGEERLNYHHVTRDTFGLPNTEIYQITWMGAELVGSPDAVVYLNTNTVKPAVNVTTLEYPANAIQELYDEDNDLYIFTGFYVYARKKSRFNPQWNPFINSGWFYTNDNEYYLYADPIEQESSTPTYDLMEQSNMGAPIMVWGDDDVQLRQVAFIEDLATPVLSDTNTETVKGNGTNKLYLAFEDIFDVTVFNIYKNKDVTLEVDSTSNEIQISEVSDFGDEYEVKYKVNNSFYAHHGHLDPSGNLTTRITTVGATPSSGYRTVFEGSDYNFATPVDLPLNPFYTLQEEGFIFISYDEFALGSVMVRVSPGHIASSDEDYVMITIFAGDKYGNPKQDQTFTVSTDWGVLSEASVTSNRDGYAFVVLTGEANPTAKEFATVVVSHNGTAVGDVVINIGEPVIPRYTIAALPTADAIPADGKSTVTIYGRVLDDGLLPVENAIISYRTGLSIRDLFESDYIGQVVADEYGRFIIGPIKAGLPDNPRTVFYSVESWGAGAPPIGNVATPNYSATPTQYGPIGDIVFWREYRSSEKFLNELTQLPIDLEIYNADLAYFLTRDNAFPIGHDEATPTQDATPNLTFDWEVPEWYAISAYKQYQLGLRGTEYYRAFRYADGSHPDYEDF